MYEMTVPLADFDTTKPGDMILAETQSFTNSK